MPYELLDDIFNSLIRNKFILVWWQLKFIEYLKWVMRDFKNFSYIESHSYFYHFTDERIESEKHKITCSRRHIYEAWIGVWIQAL